jgi:hypothetical protein
MSTSYLFIDELAFISNRLQLVFSQNTNGAAARISFKEVEQFQRQIRTWDRDFIKPPMSLVAPCSLEILDDFYRRRLDFSIFQGFSQADLEAIQEEISAYAARGVLDALIGYRLRNWAAIGLHSPKWQIYQDLVRTYYDRTISLEKRENIAVFERNLAQTADETLAEIHARCVGELFFEVDEIRLMAPRRLKGYLEGIRRQTIGRKAWQGKTQSARVPGALRDSFQLFGFSHQAGFDELKERYRQLALNYHPDKGGSLEMMQQLNAAYRQIAEYLRQVETGAHPVI